MEIVKYSITTLLVITDCLSQMGAWILACLALHVAAQPTELHTEEQAKELTSALAEHSEPGSSREEKCKCL